MKTTLRQLKSLSEFVINRAQKSVGLQKPTKNTSRQMDPNVIPQHVLDALNGKK